MAIRRANHYTKQAVTKLLCNLKIQTWLVALFRIVNACITFWKHVCIFEVLGRVNISGHWRPYWMIRDDIRGPWGLKLPDICLTGEEKPRKNHTQETCPTGDRTRARCVTGVHATAWPTAVDHSESLGLKYERKVWFWVGICVSVVQWCVKLIIWGSNSSLDTNFSLNISEIKYYVTFHWKYCQAKHGDYSYCAIYKRFKRYAALSNTQF